MAKDIIDIICGVIMFTVGVCLWLGFAVAGLWLVREGYPYPGIAIVIITVITARINVKVSK